MDSAEPGVTGDNSRDGDRRSGPVQKVADRAVSVRAWVRRRPGGAAAWRILIAVLGLIVIVVGIILLIVPGPGWVTIFLGLGIWATEFSWARNLLKFVRRQVGIWTKWVGRQPRWISISLGAAGLILVAVVAWAVST